MFKNYHRLLAHVLLACLTLQPFTAAAAFSWQPPSQQTQQAPELFIPADFQASETLQSPWKKDFSALEFLSQFPLHANKDFLELMRNKQPVSAEALEKQYTAQEVKDKRAWVKLFNNLQFVNEEGKKSAMTGLGRTITQAGRLSFLNIIAQENTDVGIAKKRQEFIKYLVENPDYLRQIQEQLHVIKKFESEPLERLSEKDPLDAFPPEIKKQIELNNKIVYGYLALCCYAVFTSFFVGLGKGMQDACKESKAGLGAVAWKNRQPTQTEYDELKQKLGVIGKAAPAVMNFKPGPVHTLVVEHMLIGLMYLLYKKYNELETIGNVIGGGMTYLFSVLSASMAALTVLSTVSPKTGVSTAGTIVELGIVHPLAAIAQTLARICYFAWSRKSIPVSFSHVHSVIHEKMNNSCNRKGQGFQNYLNSPISSTFRYPRNWFVIAGMLAATGILYLILTASLRESKKCFNQANGVANIAKSAQKLHVLLQQVPLPDVASGYTQSLQSVSALYKKIQSRATSSFKYGPEAEYTPLNFFIHNTARDKYILQNVKATYEDFSKISQFYGEIDAYASVAQLMIDHQTIRASHGESIRCCFVEFINNPVESMLVAEDMWHPIIPTTHVRTNSIALGNSAENPRNGIITGPNAAGKSVSMKALLINIVLGQSFGIACAKSFKFTVFKKVIARFNSVDDTAGEQSKFMLEAADVVALLKELKSLKPGEKAFVITDELFSGTEVNPAILLSFELCARVSRFPNVCYLLATHYKDLTQLKEITGQQFENFKVSAFVVDNKVHYPFKLTKGVGDVNVAFDIFLDQMEKQGVKDADLESIIANARKRQHLLEHNTGAILA